MSLTNRSPEAPLTRPWPAERIEHWAIERLIPHADNARIHSEADIDKLAGSLRRWGRTNPVLVDENGELICGHGRACAAAKLGLSSVPVMVAHPVFVDVAVHRWQQFMGRAARRQLSGQSFDEDAAR